MTSMVRQSNTLNDSVVGLAGFESAFPILEPVDQTSVKLIGVPR